MLTKGLSTILLIFLIFQIGNTQNTSESTVNTNNIEATIYSFGFLFWDSEDGKFLPKINDNFSPATLIKAFGLWI